MQKLLSCFLVTAFTLAPARAQDDDQAYLAALVSVQAVGTMGAMVKDWCDQRSAQGQDAHTASLSKWRKSFALDEIDARLAARKRAPAVDLQDKRASLHARLDEQYKKPDAVCGNLEKFLLKNFDPKQMFPAEYKLAFSQPPSAEARRPETATDIKPQSKAAQPRAASGNGPRIQAVWLESAWTAWGTMEYRPIVLFADGTYTRDANAATNSDVQPQGRWRKEGNGYSIDNNGKPKFLRPTMVARAARRAETINRHYWSLRCIGGAGTAMVMASKDYFFAPDGTVRFAHVASATTNDQMGAPEGSSGHTQSKASGAHRYSLDGYVITLTLADGTTARRLFYFYPDGDTVIGIGGGAYVSN